jgi:hypothetical protein
MAVTGLPEKADNPEAAHAIATVLVNASGSKTYSDMVSKSEVDALVWSPELDAASGAVVHGIGARVVVIVVGSTLVTDVAAAEVDTETVPFVDCVDVDIEVEVTFVAWEVVALRDWLLVVDDASGVAVVEVVLLEATPNAAPMVTQMTARRTTVETMPRSDDVNAEGVRCDIFFVVRFWYCCSRSS